VQRQARTGVDLAHRGGRQDAHVPFEALMIHGSGHRRTRLTLPLKPQYRPSVERLKNTAVAGHVLKWNGHTRIAFDRQLCWIQLTLSAEPRFSTVVHWAQLCGRQPTAGNDRYAHIALVDHE
jgi:hypothetical protein